MFHLSPPPHGAGRRSLVRAAALSRQAGLVLLLVGPGCVFVSKDDIAARKDLDGDNINFDEDCDDNDSSVGAPQTWYVDEDNDSFGAGEEQTGCEPPDRIADNADDCDDADPLVNPGAAEVYYNDKDDDCAGEDANGDGAEDDKDKDSDGATVDVDCDDEDPDRFPDDSIDEIYYNGLDDDCNLDTADGDQDGDGYWHVDYENLVIASGERPMSIPDGDSPGDCWDDPAEATEPLNDRPELAASDINPGASETHYDGIDQDCAGVDADGSGIDDDFDQDGDGFATAAYVDADGSRGGDCLDCLDDACRTEAGEIDDPAGLEAPNVNPDATDVWYDGTDADCDGADDYDFDRDGDPVPAGGGGDCNDEDPLSYTGATDTWYDGVDRDCAGNSDFDADGDFWVPDTYAGRTTTNAPGARQDGSGDCWDNPAVTVPFPTTTVDGSTTYDADDFNPGATDAWYDGVDLDCGTDNDFDADGDGHSSDSHPTYAGPVAGDDCDDTEASTNPGATEVCNDGVDNDCSTNSAPCGVTSLHDEDDAYGVIFDADSTSGTGWDVDARHDIDGDGTNDIIIADPYDSLGSTSSGTVSIHSGTPTGNANIRTKSEGRLYGSSTSEGMGQSITGVGDIDGDGYDEVFIGSAYNDDFSTNNGAAYLVHGPITAIGKASSNADLEIYGTETGAQLGAQVASGDVSNDGTADLIVSARNSDYNGWSSGRLFMIEGGETGLFDSDFTSIEGIDEYTYTGESLAVADLSGDGVADLIAGSQTAVVDSQGSAGLVGVLYGPITSGGRYDLGSDGDVFIQGSEASAYLGSALSVGDLDGDGTPDLVVSSRYAEGPTGDRTGEVYVYFGGLGTTTLDEDDADATISTTVAVTTTLPQIGFSIAADGDLDGDGQDDLVIGAPYGGPALGGAVYVQHGPLSAGSFSVTNADGAVANTSSGTGLGYSVSVGEVSGDRTDDLIIGQPADNNPGYGDGQVLIFTGGVE